MPAHMPANPAPSTQPARAPSNWPAKGASSASRAAMPRIVTKTKTSLVSLDDKSGRPGAYRRSVRQERRGGAGLLVAPGGDLTVGARPGRQRPTNRAETGSARSGYTTHRAMIARNRGWVTREGVGAPPTGP